MSIWQSTGLRKLDKYGSGPISSARRSIWFIIDSYILTPDWPASYCSANLLRDGSEPKETLEMIVYKFAIAKRYTRFHPDMQHFQIWYFRGLSIGNFDPENLPRSCSNRHKENRSIKVNLGRIRIRRFTPKILGVEPY